MTIHKKTRLTPIQRKQLATEIVRRYHDDDIAREERQWFNQTFSMRQIPADCPELVLESKLISAFEIVRKLFGNQKSNSEIRRLFEQGAVKINGVKVESQTENIRPSDGDAFQIGKRVWFRIKVR